MPLLQHRSDKQVNKQNEIADILKKQAEVKEDDIAAFTRLARYFYNLNNNKDRASEADGEIKKNMDPEVLYTLIKYDNKDTLVTLGTGDFDDEMFMRRDIPEFKGFSHSPLPLFVVGRGADEEYKQSYPKKFLNRYAAIISPKGGEIIFSTGGPERQEKTIDYGKIHIMHYNDAVDTLQNALLNKMFKSADNKEKAVEEIITLQGLSQEEFDKRARRKQDHYTDIQKIIFGMLEDMSDKENTMYAVLKLFNVQKINS
ncbi:MAG: hypothetical protein WC606_00565 [Candidatus Absconditabacterales bacterium]